MSLCLLGIRRLMNVSGICTRDLSVLSENAVSIFPQKKIPNSSEPGIKF